MNPPCAYCKKTVYPTEKFNCLDKIWHKGCFRCTQCSLKLTMNTYKGYDKMPYCNAHYPKLKHTQVSKTAEGERLQKITQQQSSIEYHSEFNKAKGAKMSVADDPETMRQMKVSSQQSSAVYKDRSGQKKNEESRRPLQDDEPEQGGGGYQPPAQPYNPPAQAQSYNPPPPAQSYNPPPPAQSYNPPPAQSYEPEPEPEPEPPAGQKRFRALYDYSAADDDEICFQEDAILDGTIIDEGWLEGQLLNPPPDHVGSTYGMVPRNYFEEL